MKNKQTAPKKTGAKASKKPASKKVAVIENASEEIASISEESPAEEQQVEASTELEIPVEDEQLATKGKGRDNSTFNYNGQDYKKGPLVRQIISDHVAASKGKITYKQLKEAFPDELLRRFAPFMDEDKARELSGARDRYFFKPEHLIKLKDKTIAVCNQWTAGNIRPFLQAAKQLGYKIK